MEAITRTKFRIANQLKFVKENPEELLSNRKEKPSQDQNVPPQIFPSGWNQIKTRLSIRKTGQVPHTKNSRFIHTFKVQEKETEERTTTRLSTQSQQIARIVQQESRINQNQETPRTAINAIDPKTTARSNLSLGILTNTTTRFT